MKNEAVWNFHQNISLDLFKVVYCLISMTHIPEIGAINRLHFSGAVFQPCLFSAPKNFIPVALDMKNRRQKPVPKKWSLFQCRYLECVSWVLRQVWETASRAAIFLSRPEPFMSWLASAFLTRSTYMEIGSLNPVLCYAAMGRNGTEILFLCRPMTETFAIFSLEWRVETSSA